MQQFYGDIQQLREEIRRLRGELHRLALGGIILPGVNNNSTIPPPLAGALIRGNSTPGWERLAIGAEGEILTVVSGLPQWEPVGPAGNGMFYVPFGSGSETFTP